MDPISAIASVTAVIELSAKVLLFCYNLQRAMKDAPSDINLVIDELWGLDKVLKEIHEILENRNVQSVASASALTMTDAHGPLATAKHVLDELSDKISPLAKPGLKVKLLWTFESKAIQRKMEIIQQAKATLLLTMSTLGTNILVSNTEKLDAQGNLRKREAVLKWYKTSDPETNHRQSREKREPNTSTWILEHKTFVDWFDAPESFLWMHGIPGAGKTILCSTVIDHIQTKCRGSSTDRAVYFYFDFADSRKQSILGFLKSIVYQLASTPSVLPETAMALYHKHNGVEEPSVNDLMEVFVELLPGKATTFLCVDALDECPKGERRLFFHLFAGIFGKKLKILATSRKEVDIEDAVTTFPSLTIKIENAAVDADVRKFTGSSITRDPTLSKWPPKIQHEMLDAIVGGANGMFRWAVCQLETMKTCLTPAMIRKELKRMPENLDQMYDRILQAIPILHQPYARSALHWLAFAARPLLLSELAEASIIDPMDVAFDLEDSRLLEDSKVLELCGALVTVSTKEFKRDTDDWLTEKLHREVKTQFRYATQPRNYQVISLSHQSVKEYLISDGLRKSVLNYYHTSEAMAHELLAECSLTYLLALSPGVVSPQINFKAFPLLFYAARFWMHHWRLAHQQQSDSGSILGRLTHQLLDPHSRSNIANWLNIWDFETLYQKDKSYWSMHSGNMKPWVRMKLNPQLHPSALYISASLGDLQLVKSFVNRACDVSERAGYFGCSLATAAYLGHRHIVEYLLSSGADPNLSCGSKYGTVLQTACVGGDVAIVRTLLDAGANINTQGGLYNTAIVAATSNEHFDVAKLLLSRGADMKLESSEGCPLYAAASTGDLEMVKMLLGTAQDINHIGFADGTPLYGASLAGSVPIVQLLLRHGAEPNRKGSGEFGYPLNAAARKGHIQVCRILLTAGADPNVYGGYRGVTALERAIESRDMTTFRLILDGGADPNMEAYLYINALHAAILNGSTEMARTLLERGAHFDDFAFIYSIARYDQHPWFFHTMLDREANVDAHDGYGGSALMLAVAKRHETVIWSLLKKNPYIDALGADGTALCAVARTGMLAVAKELLELGASVDKCAQQTPFEIACRMGHLEMAKLLLQNGASIKANSCVTGAVDSGSAELLRCLAANGADLNQVDPLYGCSPIQCAASRGNLKIIALLLDLGAPINGLPTIGGPIIRCAIESGDETVVRFVVERGAIVCEAEPDRSELWRALKFGMPELVPLLLEHGARVDAQEGEESAVGLAWSQEREEIVSLLLSHGAKFSRADAGILFDAIETKPIEKVQELLDNGIDPNCHNLWRSSISTAVSHHKKDVVELLLEYGCDVNAHEVRCGALYEACLSGNAEMVELLLDNGADPNCFPEGYRYPLLEAVRIGDIQIIDLLLEHDADIRYKSGNVFAEAIFGGEETLSRLLKLPMTPAEREAFLDRALQSALHYCKLDLSKWLVDQGANLHFVGGEHGSPLQAAVSNTDLYDPVDLNNKRLILAMLIDYGVNVNNEGGKAPALTRALEHGSRYKAASEHGSRSTANFLLDAGADVKLGGGELYSPLQAACLTAHIDIVGRLIKGGAEVNARGGTYGSPLHAIAYNHNVEGIKLLMENGAETIHEICGKYGSVMQTAAKANVPGNIEFRHGRDSVRAMELLFSYGASPTARGGRYGCALQMAAKSNNFPGVKWLIAHGADPTEEIEDSKYKTALNAARVKKRYVIISFLEQQLRDRS